MAETNGDAVGDAVDDGSPSTAEDCASETGDGFKGSGGDADDSAVDDGIGARPRLAWHPVNDTDASPLAPEQTHPRDRTATPAEGAAPVAPGFRFDLGGALSRQAGGADPAGAPGSRRARATSSSPPAIDVVPPPPVQTPPSAAPVPVAADPLPTWQAPVAAESLRPGLAHAADAAPSSEAPGHVAPPSQEPPVHDEPAPRYPKRVPGARLEEQQRRIEAAAMAEPHQPATERLQPGAPRPSVFDDGMTSHRSTGAPGDPAAMWLPTLPASDPAAPPWIVQPTHGARSSSDVDAFRSSQLRAREQQRQGKLLRRALLAFIVVGGLISAALLFGQSLLFTTQWDADLTPIVDEIQADRGDDFDHAVDVVAIGAVEFGDRLRSGTVGEAWIERIPAWRALGLTTGTVTAESVASTMAADRPAFYDFESDTIYRLADADLVSSTTSLRLALEHVWARQHVVEVDVDTEVDAGPSGLPGFTGVSDPLTIATRAVDEFLATGGDDERVSADETLPIPIAYELAAVGVLGEPILAGAGIDPADLASGDGNPDDLGAALDDGPVNTPSALLEPGERSLADPVALGTDDWSLVWGTRLPDDTVQRLVAQVTADSYRLVDRDGTTCVIGVFEAVDVAAGAEVFEALVAWADTAAAESQATATQLSPQRSQLTACDPGADFAVAPMPGVADALIDRQVIRLTD